MAGLKKPAKCNCGNATLHREYNPERWVCDKCETIVRSRQKKPDKNSCRECGAPRDSKPFKSGKNLCLDCYNTYMRDWNDKNKPEVLQRKKNYYAANRDKIRERSNAYWQGSVTAFLTDAFRRVRNTASKRFGKRARALEFTITFDHLLSLFIKQDGCCALSGMKMEHKWDSLKSISIDRIDSSLGYTPDNVQLVCKWVNLAKSHHSQGDFISLLDELVGCYCPSQVGIYR